MGNNPQRALTILISEQWDIPSQDVVFVIVIFYATFTKEGTIVTNVMTNNNQTNKDKEWKESDGTTDLRVKKSGQCIGQWS